MAPAKDTTALLCKIEKAIEEIDARIKKVEQWIDDWEKACEMYEQGVYIEHEPHDLWRDRSRDH